MSNHVTIDNYYLLSYAKQKVRINSYTCYYFDDIIQLEDLNLDIF